MEGVLAAQRRYFDSGATRPLRFRREVLTRLELVLTRWERELLETLGTDLNKSPYEGYTSELNPTLTELCFARGHLKKQARPVRHPASLPQFPPVSTVYRELYGVSLILILQNYPLLLVLAPLVSAIAAGCMAVVKPGGDAPASARALAEVLGRVFPPKYIAVAERGRGKAEALVDKPFDVVLFTGSPVVGRKVMTMTAEYLTPVTLEPGGRSPMILASDADMKLAVARVTWDKFLNVGQTCVAPGHVWIPEGMAELSAAALAREITRFYGENPLAEEELPRIINRQHFDRLAGLLSGGRIAVDGRTDLKGLRVTPTVLVDVPEGSPMLEKKVFGPILPVLLYRSLPELVKTQRQKPHPLALYLFTRSHSVKRAVLETLPFGGGCVNDTVVYLTDPCPPFDGARNSGMGACHGKAGFDTFIHEKSVFKKRWLDIPVRHPPYGKKHLSILKKSM